MTGSRSHNSSTGLLAEKRKPSGTKRTAEGCGRAVGENLTPDEEEVLLVIRRTPYGETHVKTRAGMIVGIRREETIKPPSQQLELQHEPDVETDDN